MSSFLNSQDQVEAEFEAFKAELKVLHQLKDKDQRVRDVDLKKRWTNDDLLCIDVFSFISRT